MTGVIVPSQSARAIDDGGTGIPMPVSHTERSWSRPVVAVRWSTIRVTSATSGRTRS